MENKVGIGFRGFIGGVNYVEERNVEGAVSMQAEVVAFLETRGIPNLDIESSRLSLTTWHWEASVSSFSNLGDDTKLDLLPGVGFSWYFRTSPFLFNTERPSSIERITLSTGPAFRLTRNHYEDYGTGFFTSAISPVWWYAPL